MHNVSPEEVTRLKREIYDRMSPRRRKWIDKIGFDEWDPFQEPLHPIDIRQETKKYTPQELMRAFLRITPENRRNGLYAKGAMELVTGMLDDNEKYLGMRDFAIWFMEMEKDAERLKREVQETS